MNEKCINSISLKRGRRVSRLREQTLEAKHDLSFIEARRLKKNVWNTQKIFIKAQLSTPGTHR